RLAAWSAALLQQKILRDRPDRCPQRIAQPRGSAKLQGHREMLKMWSTWPARLLSCVATGANRFTTRPAMSGSTRGYHLTVFENFCRRRNEFHALASFRQPVI